MTGLANRRRESRRLVQGPITLILEGPLPFTVAGTLVDISGRGFCAKFESGELQRGDRTRFSHRDAVGSAIVIWTRILGAMVEAGFQVIE